MPTLNAAISFVYRRLVTLVLMALAGRTTWAGKLVGHANGLLLLTLMLLVTPHKEALLCCGALLWDVAKE